MIRVLVVAHSMIVRAGLEALLLAEPTLEVVGTISRMEGLEQSIDSLQPDVVLLESEALEEEISPTLLGEGFPVPATLLLVDDLESPALATLLPGGIGGILPIEATGEEIIAAIATVAAGLIVLHPQVVKAVLPQVSHARLPIPTASQSLTPREIEVLRMLAEGLGNKAIARRLTISEHTVKFHISSILSKLNASSRTEAVTIGARQGLILL